MRELIHGLGAVAAGATLLAAAAKVGQPAPDFTARSIEGKVYRLSDLKGKIVVLEAFNLDCPFCRNHYATGAMQELQKRFAAKGVVWLLINSVHKAHPSYRAPEEAKAEMKKFKIAHAAWIDDSDGKIGKAFGMRTTPHVFVIDKKGALVYAGAVDDRPAPSGDPRTARNYLKEALEALLSGKAVPVSKTRPYGCSVKYAR